MSWGPLGGSQTKRKVSDPLPEFLVDDNFQLGLEREKPSLKSLDGDESTLSYKRQAYDPEGVRPSYGVRPPAKSMIIETSHKTIFVSFLFFAAAILLAFGVGFFFGRGYTEVSLETHVKAGHNSRPLVPVQSEALQIKQAPKVVEEKTEALDVQTNKEELEKEENIDGVAEELEEDEESLD